MFLILYNRDSTINLKHLLQMRLKLDRRRLEEAFLLSASLEIIGQFNLWDKLPSLPCDRKTKEATPVIYSPFLAIYVLTVALRITFHVTQSNSVILN